MRTDVAGRVRNTTLAASKPLLPLYEAVVNSIQAIEDAGVTDGRITIDVVRDKSHMMQEIEPGFGDVIGFQVEDNGVGFNDDNFAAFETSDTRYKEQRGGKGVGRFLWLVAFERVNVVSDYEQDGRSIRRSFGFVADSEGIHDHIVEPSPENGRVTKVELMNFRPKYREHCPRKLDTLAAHMVEHCLEFFIRPDPPVVTLRDRDAGESLV